MASNSLVIVLVVASFCAFLVSVPPFLIQLQDRNVAFCILIISVMILNFIHIVNPLIWFSEDPNSWWTGQVFCDIQIRLVLATHVAIPGAATCIFRRLSHALDPSLRPFSDARKKRTRILLYTLCIIIPAARMILVYVVQSERYVITRVYGCTLSVDGSWPSFVLLWLWPPTIAVAGAMYGCVTIHRIFIHQRATNIALGRAQNSRNRSRTMRVCIFWLSLLIAFIPYQIYVLYYNIPQTLVPYSWSRVHPPDWSRRIVKLHLAEIGSSFISGTILYTLFSSIIFVCLGFGPNAMDTYKEWFARLQASQWSMSRSRKPLTQSSREIPMSVEPDIHRQIANHYELEATSTVRQDEGAL